LKYDVDMARRLNTITVTTREEKHGAQVCDAANGGDSGLEMGEDIVVVLKS
jgi:hypothetical protein